MNVPVDEIRSDLHNALENGETVVLKAPTGSGKSTRVPGIAARACAEGVILIVQPRRMAARLLASYVAQLEGSSVGEKVGYAVRFDTRQSARTRLLFVTDGVLLRRLTSAEGLQGVAAVIFDEYHERRLASDIALGLCREIKATSRPDLGLIVMSATFEPEAFRDYLPDARCLQASGRTYPVEIVHQAPSLPAGRGGRAAHPAANWERAVQALKAELPRLGDDDRVLIFLPGRYEIQKATAALSAATWTGGWDIAALHGSLPPGDQDRAVRSDGGRRIIVSTNVAETSLTIPGVTLVIDSGDARMAVFDARRGFDTLLIREISQASAEQRAGRAGRTRAGRCVRLWSEANHRKREAYELAEVQRVDLAETVLTLAKMGYADVGEFPWFDQPAERLIEWSSSLLRRLGALDGDGGLTPRGRQMAALPLHPRLGRLILAAQDLGCVAEAIFAAAVLQGEGVFLTKKTGRVDCQTESDTDDFAAEWLAFETARRARFDVATCNRLGVLARGARETGKAMEQLASICQKQGISVGDVMFTRRAEAFGKAMLAAWPDRVGVRLSASTLSSRLAGGRKGVLADTSIARDAQIFLATEVIEIGGASVRTQLDRCVIVQREWLAEQFPDALSESAGGEWDDVQRRVVFERQVMFYDLVLESEPVKDADFGVAAGILASKVLAGELVMKNWTDRVEQWICRLQLVAKAMPEMEMPTFDEGDRLAALEQICHGAVGYKDIKNRDPWPVLHDWLSAPQKAVLDAYAPERLLLENGASAKLRYQSDGPPVIAMKVQQLYGVRETPTVADGRVPVMLHICAPNQRPWQMTSDLSSFWATGFEQMKKDLAGRYPKHNWDGPAH